MNYCLLLVLSFVCLDRAWASIRAEEESSWSYSETEDWDDDYPECGGNKQSPIHLSSFASYAPFTPAIKFKNYGVRLLGNLTLNNNGHTAHLQIPATRNGGRPSITGALLQNRYEAQSLHFHWGSPSEKGSEHTVDNRRFDVEMHIVHKNVKYPTMDEAIQHADGLAVLAVMFKIVDVADHYYPGLDKIFEKLPEIVRYNSTAELNGALTLGHVLGDLDTKDFFTYAGSLTTPPCSEAVSWLVFPKPLPVARKHIEKFWQLFDSHDEPLLDNFRPIQRRGNRPVYHRVGGFNPTFLRL